MSVEEAKQQTKTAPPPKSPKAAEVEQAAATRWRVRADKVVSVAGAHTVVRAGQVIDSAGWTAAAVQSLRVQGVELEEFA